MSKEHDLKVLKKALSLVKPAPDGGVHWGIGYVIASAAMARVLGKEVSPNDAGVLAKCVGDLASLDDVRCRLTTPRMPHQHDLELVVGLSLDLEGAPQVCGTFGNAKFEIVSSTDARVVEHKKRVLAIKEGQMERNVADKAPRSALVVTGRSANKWSFFIQSLFAIQAIGGAIEFAANELAMSVTLIRDNSVADVHTTWGTAVSIYRLGDDSESEVKDIAYPIRQRERTQSFFIPKQWTSLQEVMNLMFSATSSGLHDRLSRCFYLMRTAVEIGEPTFEFLHYWQILETVTLSSEFKGDTSTVCKRVASCVKIAGIDEEVNLAALQGIAAKRNEFTHNGLSAIEQRDLDLVRMYAMLSIRFLVRTMRTSASMRRLEWYFRLVSQSQSEQSAVFDALRSLGCAETPGISLSSESSP